MAGYYQKDIETMSREKITELQNERLVKQIEFVYENSKYYRKKMDEMGVLPNDIKSTFRGFRCHTTIKITMCNVDY